MTFRLAFIITLLAFALSSNAQLKNKPAIHPIPNWVKPIKLPETAVESKYISDGYYYLLIDEQTDYNKQTYFSHYATKIISDVGVQNNSDISISYDPSYQQLFFHTLHIIRNGLIINKLNLSSIQTMQRESRLEAKIYDGSYTAHIGLSDVRKNDIIEYSYSIIGRNPVLKNKIYGFGSLAFSMPVVSINYRFIADQNKRITYKTIGDLRLEPRIEKQGTQQIISWNTSCLTPKLAEADRPSWHVFYPYAELTEYNSWAEVVDWASDLYPEVNITNGDALKLIKSISNKTRNEQLLSLLRFVQDDIRYMGVEMGTSSHKPHHPDKVFEQRFGDCKDKAYLLCVLLKKVGIIAYPVLISSTQTRLLKQVLPSPLQFDHVTVCVLMDNEKYFFDPTISHQRGLLNEIQYPDYKYGLIIKPGEKNLTEISNINSSGKTELNEEFIIGDTLKEVALNATTIYYGKDADRMRYTFSSQSLTETTKTYLDYYSGLYGDVSVSEDVTWSDDTIKNTFTVNEHYAIKKPWAFEDGRWKLTVYPQAIQAMLLKPEQLKRNDPYVLSYPLEYKQRLTLKLTENWKITPETNTINTPYFNYQTAFRNDGDRTIELSYEYKTLTDAVDPENIADYIKRVDEARKYNSYELYYSSGNSVDNSQQGINSLTTIVFLITAFASAAALKHLYKRDVPAFYAKEEAMQVGGWIVLPILNLLFTIGYSLYNLFWINNYFSQSTWNYITDPSSTNYHPSWGTLYMTEMILTIVLISIAVFSLIMIFQRRSTVPVIMISYFIFLALYHLFEKLSINIIFKNSLETELDKETNTALMRSIIGACIWIPYFIYSDRIKRTFVFTYKAVAEQPANEQD